MTCIVAIVDGGSILMGADSAGVGGLSMNIRKDPKVFINGDMIMGFTSSFRMGQILMHSFKAPKHPKGMDTFEYMTTLFVDEVRKSFKDKGYNRTVDSELKGGCFLVGYKKKLFKIESDFQVGMPSERFDSCGCGDDVAFGSLFSTKGRNPYDRIRLALKAAERYSAGVRAPFLIKEL